MIVGSSGGAEWNTGPLCRWLLPGIRKALNGILYKYAVGSCSEVGWSRIKYWTRLLSGVRKELNENMTSML